MSEVKARVTKTVVSTLGVRDDKIIDSASFVDDLGADSLDVVELIMAFEEEFDIAIPDEDADSISTVAEAVVYIEKATKR